MILTDLSNAIKNVGEKLWVKISFHKQFNRVSILVVRL